LPGAEAERYRANHGANEAQGWLERPVARGKKQTPILPFLRKGQEERERASAKKLATAEKSPSDQDLGGWGT
jgi:hypothetical protein